MAFGSGGFGGFGQQNQPASGFGSFGSNNNNGAAGAFGATGAGAFGAKPAFGATTSAGSSLFGSTTTTAGPTFGSGGGFGNAAAAATPSPFGSGAAANPIFGAAKPAFGTSTSTGGLFGNSNNTPGGFGSNTPGFGAAANPGLGTNIGDPPGTAAVPFTPFVEKENTSNQQTSYQNVLFMDAYKKWSAEELRLADYNQGRRFGNATGTGGAGAFGVSSNFGGFGANTTSTTTGGGLFGSANTTTNTFGSAANNNAGGFGSTSAGGGLFGSKPATTGGLFGSAATTQPAATGGLFGSAGGGFGSGTTTTSGFGNSNNAAGGGLFGNAAAQAKPATGFGGFGATSTGGGFGTTTTTGGFGAANNNAAAGGGGLFGGGATNTATNTTGGLFGSAAPATTTGGFGASAGTGFGAANTATGGGLFGAKPATGGLFGNTAAAPATNTATGGGLFGNTAGNRFGTTTTTQTTGGLFGNKPAAPAGGGLFGGAAAQPTATATGGGLFGNIGQPAQAQNQLQGGSSLFGGGGMNNTAQAKPSLFGTTSATTGSLFGNQPASQPASTGLFGQSTAGGQPQANALGGSLFGSSLTQGANLGASQGLTTSIGDAGAYGAPSLFQSLVGTEIHNPGPLATPLSGNKAKTSRRSSILPLYKMNPSSASKFATPQKRTGYGFSYSAFGTPNSASSVTSTPGSMSQSLFAGSIGRGLGKSISSSSLRRTYTAEDSVLLPGAFSTSTSGPRYYGSTGSKKFVINREMRSDLFSTPTKPKDKAALPAPSGSGGMSEGLAPGSSRKLSKRVSFETTMGENGSAAGAGSAGANGGGFNGSGETDLGYLRPVSRTSSSTSSTNGASGRGSTGSAASSAAASPSTNGGDATPEMEQVTGKELAIVHEEESSPVVARCIPDDYNVLNMEPGEYWMSPSKESIEKMNRVQRQQVANFIVGRTNVGQVRFRVPVDLSKIDLDTIMGGIVVLVVRSATVYPEKHAKPPVGQGLNVPAEITLLHTWPRAGPNASAARFRRHLTLLKSIPDTKFVSYDEKTAAWVFTVEHFTTYGLDYEDEDEDEETTDAEMGGQMVDVSKMAAADEEPGSSAPTPVAGGRRRKNVQVPGAFDDMVEDDNEDDEAGENEGQMTPPRPSFLSSRSAEMSSLAIHRPAAYAADFDGDDMELGEDGLMAQGHEAAYLSEAHPTAEHDLNSLEDASPPARAMHSLAVPLAPPETPAGIVRARLRAIKEANTPLKVQVADGDNWMEMLQKTVSPQKRDRAALRAMEDDPDAAAMAGTQAFRQSTFAASQYGKKSTMAASLAAQSRQRQDNRGFATSIDLMNSLFEKAKAPPAQEPQPLTKAKGFVKWPYKRHDGQREDEADMDPRERAYHETPKPAWSADGACILGENDEDDGMHGQVLKRVFPFAGGPVINDHFDSIADHKECVDIEVRNGVPGVSTRRIPEIKAFAASCEQANRRRPSTADAMVKRLGQYEQSVWELASVLFDPLEPSPGSSSTPLSAKESTRRRRENLSRYWAHMVREGDAASVSAPAREQELAASSHEARAVLHLARHRVPEACKALVDGKNLKAATLVSLMGSSNAFKRDMREQFEDWQQGDVLAEFGVPLRTLYALLAGSVAVCQGKKGSGGENRMATVVIADYFGLDWKQAFGLRLWYGIAAGEGLEAAVRCYVEDLEQGRVPAPQPWYCEDRRSDRSEDRQSDRSEDRNNSRQREDLLFGLLKVAAGLARLEDVLEPENSQPSPFRYRLCWQLGQVLAAVPALAAAPGHKAALPVDKADALTSAYAAEVLYAVGHDDKNDSWAHAIWVLLHLSDPLSRLQSIQDVLGRHVGRLFAQAGKAAAAAETEEGDRGREVGLYEQLVDELRVPAAWIWQAAALYWRNQQRQPAVEAECLLRAAAYTDAHRLFVRELAPKAMVERNYGEMREMLSRLQPHRHQISDWALGGDVYGKFLDLVVLQHGGSVSRGDESGGSGSTGARTRGRQQQQQAAKAGAAEQASAQLAHLVESLVASLPAMYSKASDAGPAEVAAITEMADVVAQETMALARQGRMDIAQISRLPLTDDRRLRYSTDLAFAYYQEVMSVN